MWNPVAKQLEIDLCWLLVCPPSSWTFELWITCSCWLGSTLSKISENLNTEQQLACNNTGWKQNSSSSLNVSSNIFCCVYPVGNLFCFDDMIQRFFKILARHTFINVGFWSLMKCAVRSTCSLNRRMLTQVMFLKVMLWEGVTEDTSSRHRKL